MNVARSIGLWMLLALGTASASAQLVPALQADLAPLCDPAVIDSGFTFANLPAREQIVSLHLQNKGTVSCRLHGQGGSSFAVDSHSMATATCWLCDAEGKPAGRPDLQPGDQITLAPGGRGAIDFHWAATGDACQWADWTDFQFHWREEEYSDFRKDASYLFVPAAWPFHLCSAVSSSGYRAETESAMGGSVLEGQLRVSVPPHPVYNDERVTLHVERLGRPNVQAVGCAELYMVRQGAGNRHAVRPFAYAERA